MHKRTKMPQNFFSRMYQRSTDCFSTATLKVRFFWNNLFCIVLFCVPVLLCFVLYYNMLEPLELVLSQLSGSVLHHNIFNLYSSIIVIFYIVL